MTHDDAPAGEGGESEGETGEWSGYPVPFTLPRNTVYPALLPLMRTPRLSVVDWTDRPADLNGLVRFAERRNLVSARVPSHFNWPLHETNCLLAFESCCVHKETWRSTQTPRDLRTLVAKCIAVDGGIFENLLRTVTNLPPTQVAARSKV